MLIPTRTKSEYEELRRYQQFEKDTDLFATRTMFDPRYDPQQTSLGFDTKTPSKESGILLMKKTTSEDDNSLHENKESDHRDADETYHMMFYNDDEESSSKKAEKESDEIYEDKIHYNETDLNDETTQSINLRRTSAKSTLDYEQQEGSENMTHNSTAKTSIVEAVTKITLKERLRDKRRPVCSMLKLRQLNFNSPRTLPEVSFALLLRY